MYIVYFTIYDGDKLPPFYIGSTSIAKHKAGYHGTVLSKAYKEIYNSELKMNPHLFDSCIVSEHATREEATKAERLLQLKVDAANNPMYMNKAIAAPKGFFGLSLPKEEHPLYGSHNGKGHIHSYNPETLEQSFLPYIPEGNVKGRSPEYKASSHNKGRKWYNNGKEKKMFVPGTEPEGWLKGNLINETHRNKISETLRNLDPSIKDKVRKAVSEARKGPLFEYYEALYALWVKCGRISPKKFRPLAVAEGFPDLSYHSIIYGKFKVQYENS